MKTQKNIQMTANQRVNKKWNEIEVINNPFAVTSRLQIVNIATTKLHGNTVIIEMLETHEAAERFVALQYLLNA